MKETMSLSVAQNLGESSLFLPRLPKRFHSWSGVSSSPRVSIRSSAVRRKPDNKRRFYDSVERAYAKKGSYFRRKDDAAREGGLSGSVNRNQTQMKSAGYFRVYRVEVLLESDLGKDYFEVSEAVLESTAAALGCQVSLDSSHLIQKENALFMNLKISVQGLGFKL